MIRSLSVAGALTLALAATSLAQTHWQNAPQTPDPANGLPAARTGNVLVAISPTLLLLHGGQTTSGTLTAAITLEDTWIYDASTQVWSKRANGPERTLHMAAYDSARNKVVVFGGQRPSQVFEGTTYEYDLATDTWTGPIATASAPGGRPAAAFAYDPIGNRCLLQGGQRSGIPNSRGDSWQYHIDPVNGPTWTQLIADAGAANAGGVPGDCGLRWVHKMVFDSARARMVLYGGSYNLGAGGVVLTDTWEWGCDPIAPGYNLWTKVTTAAAPQNGNWHALMYDSQRRRTVMFGGNIGSGGPNTPSTELAEFDGTNWSVRTVGGVAWQNMYASGCYLSGIGACYSFSGSQVTGAAARSAASLIAPATLDVYAPIWPASVMSYGTACPTSVGIPTLDASDYAWVVRDGSQLDEYVISVNNVPAFGFCAFLISPSAFSLPLLPGCSLYVDPTIMVSLSTVADASGRATLRGTIPSDVTLKSSVAYAQAVIIDLALPNQIALSNGVGHTFGSL